MKFRPCIDIHNGKVKQIVGGSLRDTGDQARENFVSEQDAAFLCGSVQRFRITGRSCDPSQRKIHPIIRKKKTGLNALKNLSGRPSDRRRRVCPGKCRGLSDAGASHVIVTSYVFRNGRLSWEKSGKIEKETGKEHLVLDLSCRKKNELTTS